MNITELSPKQLRRAANIQEKIQDLQSELNKLLGAPAAAEAEPVAKKPRKRRMSAAGRAAISAAAKARWAKIKGKSAAKPVKKARRKMSAAAKARLSEMAKARWKKVKAAGKTKL